MAIEIPLHEIIEAAVKSGWEVTEALTAIIEVADNLVLAHGSSAGARRAAERRSSGTSTKPSFYQAALFNIPSSCGPGAEARAHGRISVRGKLRVTRSGGGI
ncbi:hypothetical protein LZK73_30555 (plasmid) [Neorhizobium galegae]|nr:hypothetical protein LZK73_30555 [Neorhizobium galegae]